VHNFPIPHTIPHTQDIKKTLPIAQQGAR